MPITATIDPELTPVLTYLRGDFALHKYTIPYFSVVVPFAFAIDKFTLIDDIPDVERIQWSIEELFQREIAWDRIENELLKYLLNENRPQFFNALTIALLPRSGHGLAGDYERRHEYPAIVDPDLESPIQVGGIQLQAYKNTEGLIGKLRWDKAEIIAVAVDGQHRLAAIKRLQGKVIPEKLQRTRIPVIFLIPDKQVGFIEPQQPQETVGVVDPLRRVFIDLNKNARPVSRTRNILLDDLDIASVCTRQLIGERLGAKPGAHRIPLAMVDWVSEQSNKFDTGPFVTTVLLLNEIVHNVLDLRRLEDPEQEDDQQVRKWIRESFAPNDQELTDLMMQVNRCYNREVPITFEPTEIAVLRDCFNKRWRPLLYRVFAELKPYRDLWEYGRDNKLHEAQFVNLYVAKELGEEGAVRASKIEDAIKSKDPDWNRERYYDTPLEHINTELKSDQWAFKVVFQKALFNSYIGLLWQCDAFIVNEGDEQKQRQTFTSRWIEAVSALLSTELALTTATFSKPKTEFWTGIGLRPDRETIDLTGGASHRVQKWIDMWVCLYCLRPEMPTVGQVEGDDRPLAAIIRTCVRDRRVRKGMEKVARAAEDPPEGEELAEAVQELIERRYNYMRKLLAPE